MRANRLALLALIIGAAAVSGCDQARQTTGPGDGGTATNCTGCHGGLDNDTGAPPRNLVGAFVATDVTIGAHSKHIEAGVACTSCHLVPGRVTDEGHMDNTPNAEVRFSGAASLGGLTPVWNRAGSAGKGTCSNVYCHGASLAAADRGQATTPTWSGNPPALAGAPCGSCHGSAATNGAPSGHATNLTPTDCNNCHAGTVTASGTIDLEGGKHIDGTVQAEYGSCSSCHGDDTRAETDLSIQAAPPKDTQGSATGDKVGAHLRHLSGVSGLGPRIRKPIQCAECHVVPTTVPHNATAVVQFGTAAGTLAKGPGGTLNPTYTAATLTCNSVYCHGTTLLGGAASKNPAWTTTYATGDAICGTCHFRSNPPAPHPATAAGGLPITSTTQCIQCHPGTVLADGTINVANDLHINGVKDVDYHPAGYAAAAVHGGPAKLDLAGCKTCHGADLNGAPASNGTSCNACHAANGASGWQTNCTLCHGEPNRAADAAQDNVGTPPVRANKAAPPLGSQDESTAAANAVGAHLAHVQAGTLAGAFKCQQCHGVSLPVDLAHVNGQVVIGWQLAATGSTPTPAAGAYPRSGTSATPVSCANYCHGATLSGGTKKTAGGAAIPVLWTGGASEATCGSCHSLPPTYAAPSWHVSDADCAKCHGYGAGNLNLTQHVNGVTNVATGLGCATCHGTGTSFAPPRAASNGATATTDPRVGAHQAHVAAGPLANAFACSACHGPTLPASLNHANGAVTIGWSALATTGGVAATPTAGSYAPGLTASCANYCHGGRWSAAGAANDQYRGTNFTPSWVGGAPEVACGSCHQVAPASPAHSSVTDTVSCSNCHAGYTCTTGNLAGCVVNKTTHVNGVADVSGQTCASCHGTAGKAAAAGTLGPVISANNLLAVPPADTGGATNGVRVGPHLAHSDPAATGAQVYKPVQCAECHGTAVNAYTVSHPNSATELTFANATGANLGGFTPTITQATAPAPDTCATYCHGATFTAAQQGSITTWQWNTGITTDCGSCHKSPPTDPFHTRLAAGSAATTCSACHASVVNAAGAIVFSGAGAAATTLHINGVVEASSATCTSCHGTAAAGNEAPPVATTGATTGVKVGAHQKHLTGTSLRTGAAAVCTDCHTRPTAMDHATGVVNVTWSAFVRTGGLTPTPAAINAAWETTPTCTNYCHGGKWAATPATAGTLLNPSWTAGAAAAACGTCHKIAPNSSTGTPAGTHPAVTSTTSCSNCHAGYACTSGNVAACTVNVTTHINGAVEAGGNGCGSCHGTAGRTYAAGTLGPVDTANNIQGAPPRDVAGAASSPQVGPHQAHVNPASQGAQMYRAALCSECHTTAVNTFATTGHAALSPKVAFTNATGANLTGFVPTYTPAANATLPDTCATYCHGATFTAAQKGSITTWQWNVGITVDCGSCHATPPADQFHTRLAKPSALTTCATCHASVVSAAGAITFTGAGAAATTLHINGLREASSATCSSCHGSATNFAPPTATDGSATGVKVGAHQKHLTSAALRAGAGATCAECHTVPGATDHANASTTVTWTGMAITGGVVPTPAAGAITAAWETTPTCTNYCHGGKWAGNATYAGTLLNPSWTAGAAGAACGTCHKVAPTSSAHATANAVGSTVNCSTCHTGYNCLASNAAACTVNATLHLNGATDATNLSCSTCHGSATNFAPPAATTGATTGVKVGAHQKHLTGTALRATALACGDCHTVPAATSHSNSVVGFTWSALAKTGGLVPTPSEATGLGAATTPSLTTWETTPTCTNYCHGQEWAANVQYRGTVTAPNWTTTTAAVACNACHLAPPTSAAHSAVYPSATKNCQDCHSGYNCTTANLAACTVNKTVHINGSAESSGDCISCHTGAQGTRRAIVPEFALAWSHKRSAAGAVTKFDCAVCHMEGDLATGNVNATYHLSAAGGPINLRDPDTGLEITNVSFTAGTATTPGSYAAAAGNPAFTRFSRNLGSATLEPAVQAIMINQCLKCHDSNGATAAFVPGGSAAKPFATTIAGAAYTGAGVTAGGTLGGVTDVNASFATTNASYHPVRGKQNNSYVGNLRMNTPWNALSPNKTGGTINAAASWGYLISCWDCHAPTGSTSATTLTATVTAHGGATQLRQQYGTANATNLCTACHLVVPVTGASTSTHGQGSAWSAGGNGTPGGLARTSCFSCHGSGITYSSIPRPVRAQDSHGFDAFAPAMGTDTAWPIGTTNTYKPYAFFRNVGPSGQWRSTNWSPKSAPGVTGRTNGTCGGNGSLGCGNDNHSTYTPGGVY